MTRYSFLTLVSAFMASGMPVFAASPVPKNYPLTTCVVSEEKLGEHGKLVKVTAPDGTDVYLCCQDCKKDFNKNPAKYSKMVTAAASKK